MNVALTARTISAPPLRCLVFAEPAIGIALRAAGSDGIVEAVTSDGFRSALDRFEPEPRRRRRPARRSGRSRRRRGPAPDDDHSSRLAPGQRAGRRRRCDCDRWSGALTMRCRGRSGRTSSPARARILAETEPAAPHRGGAMWP